MQQTNYTENLSQNAQDTLIFFTHSKWIYFVDAFVFFSIDFFIFISDKTKVCQSQTLLMG